MPQAFSLLEIHEWVFTARPRHAFASHFERVRFYALPGQVHERAWEALLASDAYDRGEHYAPTLRVRLGRKQDALSGAAIGALAVARGYVVEGMDRSQALDLIARHYPTPLTALEIAYVALALEGES